MTEDKREIRLSLRVVEHAEQIGSVSKACRYFGIVRASFYRRRHLYDSRKLNPDHTVL